MWSIRLLLAAAMAVSLQVASPPEDPPAGKAKVGERELAEAIRQLESDRFVVRQQATQTLWEAGEAARSFLEKALDSRDREVVKRVESILERFDFGLYPDTPAEDARLINLYRFGDLKDKLGVLQQFRDRGRVRMVLRLLSADEDPQARQHLSKQIFQELEKFVENLPLEDSQEDWERLMKLGAQTDLGRRHYALFLQWSGKADEVLEKLNADWRRSGDAKDARQIVFIHRMQGDLVSAIKAAARGEQPELHRRLAYEARQWTEYARLLREPIAPALKQTEDIEDLGKLAAAYRLGGDQKRLEETVEQILDVARRKPEQVFYAAEALMINDRYVEGVRLVGEFRRDWAFRLLCMRGDYGAAFKMAGLKADASDHAAWFKNTKIRAKDKPNDPDRQFELGVEVARALHRLGQVERAEKYLDELAAIVRKDVDGHKRRLRHVVDIARRLRLNKLALRLGSETIVGPSTSVTLRLLYPSDTAVAVALWSYLRLTDSSRDTLPRLQRLEAYLAPAKAERMKESQVESLGDLMLQAAAKARDNPKIAWLSAAAEVALKHGHKDLAARLFEQVAPESPAAAVRAGEIRLQQNRLPEAISWFKAAWEAERANASALYLYGWAMKKNGKVAEGRKKVRQATLLPLALATRRRELASALKRNNLIPQAQQQWRWILRSGEFQDWHVNDAAKELGNSLSGKDNLRTSEHWEQLLFSGLRKSSSFIEIEGYLQLSYLVHKARARGLLDAGKTDEALRELWLSQGATPGDVSLAEDFVPLLESKGLKKDADLFFARIFKVNSDICAAFPDSALHLNNLAWMSARCNRELDRALELSNRAVKLAPKNAGYLDTLAEVHFRQGRRAKALELIRKCLQMDPESSHFQEQLKRFEESEESGKQKED